MLISASIFAVSDNFLDYAIDLKLAGADYAHIDVFQESENFRLEDILKFSDYTPPPPNIYH